MFGGPTEDIAVCTYSDVAETGGHDLRENVGGNGVGSEDEQHPCAAAIAAHLHEEPEYGEDQQGPSCRVEDEARRPELLVDGEQGIPQQSEEHAACTGNGEDACLMRF